MTRTAIVSLSQEHGMTMQVCKHIFSVRPAHTSHTGLGTPCSCVSIQAPVDRGAGEQVSEGTCTDTSALFCAEGDFMHEFKCESDLIVEFVSGLRSAAKVVLEAAHHLKHRHI